jgi:hypothetical protein|tara:strand:- start:72 stop:359 length:288 start_codon:yes stop_codon:yes gene_type:complete
MNLKMKSFYKISSRLSDWGFDIWEQNRNTWSHKQWIQFEATWKILRRLMNAYRRQAEIIEYVETWLNTNMDEPPPEGTSEDSANLLQKIQEMKEE